MAIFLDVASAVGPGGEEGERPKLLQEAALCDDCGHVHEVEVCPKCGSFISIGYGLMFGGMGIYKYCDGENGDCDWFWKQQDPSDDADEITSSADAGNADIS